MSKDKVYDAVRRAFDEERASVNAEKYRRRQNLKSLGKATIYAVVAITGMILLVWLVNNHNANTLEKEAAFKTECENRGFAEVDKVVRRWALTDACPGGCDEVVYCCEKVVSYDRTTGEYQAPETYCFTPAETQTILERVREQRRCDDKINGDPQ